MQGLSQAAPLRQSRTAIKIAPYKNDQGDNFTPRPIIVRLLHHNMKVQVLHKHWELKAQETNFDIREDLTQCLRDILHYLHNDITEGIIDKVWTIKGIIFMRPTSVPQWLRNVLLFLNAARLWTNAASQPLKLTLLCHTGTLCKS